MRKAFPLDIAKLMAHFPCVPSGYVEIENTRIKDVSSMSPPERRSLEALKPGQK